MKNHVSPSAPNRNAAFVTPRSANSRRAIVPLIGAMLTLCVAAQASTITWATTTIAGTSTSGAGSFTSAYNWSSGVLTGSDTAYFTGGFTNSSGTTLSSFTVNVTGTQSLGSIYIDNLSTATNLSFTGGTLLLTNGGSVQDYASRGQYVNSAVVIAPESSTGNGSYTFLSGGKLVFSGGVSGGTTSGSITLNLTGAGTTVGSNSSEVEGIKNGGAAGGVSVVKNGSGTWYLTGTSTYTGSTTVNSGTLAISGTVGSQANTVVNAGTLLLDWSGAVSALANTVTTATNAINSASALVFGGGGTVALTGSAGAINSQTFNGTVLQGGASATVTTSAGIGGNVVLNLGAITRAAGSALNFSNLSSGTITTTTANTTGSILGGWATVGGTAWAVSAGNGTTAGAVSALSTYTNNTWAVGNNTAVTISSSVAASATTNSLLFSTASTVTLNSSGTAVIASGGILKSSAVGSGGTITGGTLTSGNGKDLIVNNYSANGFSLFTTIVDNKSISIGLTINGPAASLFGEVGYVSINKANTYTGATYISKGGLQALAVNTLPTYTTLAFGSVASGVTDVFKLNGYNQTIGALGATAQTTSGAGGAIAIYNGATTAGTATLTINGQTYVNGSLDNTDSTFGGVISDTKTGAIATGTALAITKTGNGSTLTLTGSNTYSGPTSVQGGVLAFNLAASGTNAQALGSGSVVNIGAVATSSGTLQYTGAAGTFDKTIYALGNGLNTVKNSGSGLLTLSGSVVKNGTILVLDGGGSGINVTGTISGSNSNSDLYITGGTTALSSVNTYNGPTWVYGGGVLVNGVSNALPTTTALILGGTDNSNGAFDLNGGNQTVAGLTGTGSGSKTVTNNGPGISILTVTGGGNYSGAITDGSGTTALSVSGGNLVLGGVNTYSGATAVSGGTLSVIGSLGNSAVAVSNTATLTGTGVVNGTVVNSGTISGGLTFNNNVTIASGATASASAFNGDIVDNGTITSALNLHSGKTLSGSGSVTNTVSGTSATINGNGLNVGAVTLYGASTLSGHNIASSVTVVGGTTSLTGTTKSTSTLSVSAQATLASANGTIDGNVAVSGLFKGASTITGNLLLTSGTLAPDINSGLTTVGGNFTMDGTSKLQIVVSGTTAGTSYNQVVVSGNVTLEGTLDLSKLSGLTLGSKITLIDNVNGGTTSGYFATILTSGSTYTATSNANYTFAVDGTEYLLNYAANTGGDGYNNDVTLTVVPEPGTWAMLVGGIGMMAFGQRLRRKAIK